MDSAFECFVAIARKCSFAPSISSLKVMMTCTSCPLRMRKTTLERLLARRPEGIFLKPFERGEIGPDLFRAACDMRLEGLVSKHRDRPMRAAGRSTTGWRPTSESY
jgi:bifunctional non-homologous end joining protein LigD